MRMRLIFTVLLSLCLCCLGWNAPALAEQKSPLTYDQIRNTGRAGICPTVSDSARGRIPVPQGAVVNLTDVCFQPVQIEVEEEKRNGEKEFLEAKPIMLYAATIGPVKAKVKAINASTLELDVTDGMTTQPTTAQMPRRELVPLLFSVKNLKAVAQGTEAAISPSTDFEGDFLVPGYRSSTFLDPRGRGSATGYESAVGLQAVQDEFEEGSIKVDELFQGTLSLRIARVDDLTGEMSGSFVSLQPSSTEQGTMESKLVRIQGLFYARLDQGI